MHFRSKPCCQLPRDEKLTDHGCHGFLKRSADTLKRAGHHDTMFTTFTKKAPDISKQVGYAKPVRFEHVLRNTRSICKIVIRFVLASAQTIPNSGHDKTRKIKRLGGCRHGRCCGQRLRPGDTDRCSTCEKLRSVEVFRGETVDLWSRWTAGL